MGGYEWYIIVFLIGLVVGLMINVRRNNLSRW
jgi:hypothetical protein